MFGNKTTKKEIENLYKRTLRLCLSLPKNISGANLIELLNLPSLEDRMEEIKGVSNKRRNKENIAFIDLFSIK